MMRVLKAGVILIPWLLAALAGLWILSIRYPADGITRLTLPFDGRSLWLTPFTPGERVNSPGLQTDGWIGQRIFAEPVYASSRLPGLYDRVTLKLEIRPLRVPQVELGLMRDEQAFAFEMRPLWSEQLLEGWRQVELGGRRGFVAAGEPDQVLLSDDPEKLMLWHSTSSMPAWQDAPAPNQSHEISLRGSHDFHVVPVDGRIQFEFLLQDMNRSREGGKNLATFRLTRGDEILWTDALSASGLADRQPTEPFSYKLRTSDLSPGVYKLTFTADNDMFIRQITTDARRWAMGPRVYFGDVVGYRPNPSPVHVWTNSLHLTVDTAHKEGLQFVRLGSVERELRDTHVSYPMDRSKDESRSPVQFDAPLGNVRLLGDGYISLTREALFLPSPRRLTPQSDPKAEGIVAVLTPYEPAELLGDNWWRVQASFDHLPEAALRYSLAVPSIATLRGAVDIRRAELIYERAPDPQGWWGVLRRELSAIRKRL